MPVDPRVMKWPATPSGQGVAEIPSQGFYTTSYPPYDPRAAEEEGLEAPLIDPVQLAAFGIGGTLEGLFGRLASQAAFQLADEMALEQRPPGSLEQSLVPEERATSELGGGTSGLYWRATEWPKNVEGWDFQRKSPSLE